MKNIRLTTPSQRAEGNPAVELDTGIIERWLDELPVKEVMTTVGRLDEAISAFNEVKVPAADRLKLLEVYFSACHSILQSYDEMRIAQLNISSKQKQQLASSILWLYIKLSHGYKIIVKEYADKPDSDKLPPCLLLTTFRALELTVSSLICSYRFGLDTPPLAYIEMHQLYAFAEHFGIADKTVKKVSGYAKSPTIASYYTLALIFVSLEPRQYDSYTLEVLFLALQPFSFDCPITHACNPDDGSFSFKINLIENQPPLLLGLADHNNKESVRYMDIGNFVSGISNWIEDNQDNSNTLLIEQELELFPAMITRLKTNLNEKKLQAVENQQAKVTTQNVKLVFDFASLESMLIMKSVNLDLNLKYKMTEWSVQSTSATGCELAIQIDRLEDELPLGGLVGIVGGGEEGESASLLNIACIGKLQQFEQGVLYIGLEYLVGSPYPLTYMMMSDEDERINATPSNGIYLLDEVNGENTPRIIVNRRHYKEAQQYLITTRGSVCMVVATKLISQTLRYAFFQFRILTGTL